MAWCSAGPRHKRIHASQPRPAPPPLPAVPCRDHDTLALQHTAAAGWGLFDAWAITRPLLRLPKAMRPLWDGRHFQG